MRLTLRIAAIAAILLFCLALHGAWRLFRRTSPRPRIILAGVGRAAGVRTKTVGRPIPSDVLFLANHQSWLDIMLLAGATGTAFVSKDDVARWQLVGWLASLNATIFIARTARSSVRAQADALRDALATGRPVALFPEGTTGRAPAVLPFRASLLSAVFPPPPSLRVQPVAIDYGGAADDIAWLGDEPAAANARRVLGRSGTALATLHFLQPIDPAAVPDRKALARLGRAAIIDALDASAPAPDRL